MQTTNIYILIDPDTHQVRYVGKANNISQRYRAHLNKARKHQIHKLNWIKSLKEKGLKPIIEIIDIVPIDDWIFWETYWIAQFKAWGFKLINYTNGGDGCTFGNQTSFKKGHKSWNEGLGNICICEECNTPFKASASSERKYCSQICTSLVKSRNPNSGTFIQGHEVWNKGSNIKLKPDKHVFQYSGLTGEFIKEWDTAKQASITLNVSAEGIGQVCRKKAKSCGGYNWSYDRLDINPVIFAKKANTLSLKNLK